MCSRTAFVAAILITSLPLPILAHDIYSHLKDEAGKSCCDNSDCRPAPYRLRPTGVEMFVDGQWIEVPSEKVQYRALPGDDGKTRGGHWCGFSHEPAAGPLGILQTTNCAILPPQAASAQ